MPIVTRSGSARRGATSVAAKKGRRSRKKKSDSKRSSNDGEPKVGNGLSNDEEPKVGKGSSNDEEQTVGNGTSANKSQNVAGGSSVIKNLNTLFNRPSINKNLNVSNACLVNKIPNKLMLNEISNGVYGMLKDKFQDTDDGSSVNDNQGMTNWNKYSEIDNRTLENSKDRPLDLGKNYVVCGNDEKWYSAEILHTRFNIKEQAFEYYVHCDGINRRLDRWVPSDRIKESKVDEKLQTANQLVRKSIRNNKHKFDVLYDVQMSSGDMDPTTAALEKEFMDITKVKYITTIQLGKYEIDTWYFSPYPDGFQEPKLWICEYCLKYSKLEISFKYHMSQCTWRKPPGVEVYHNGLLSIWEVNPSENKLYCQNLSLLAKLFLDHKTIFFDVEPFLFYVMCIVDRTGAHLVGYFSKEKFSLDGYNVACILVLPHFQKQGYGKLLISFSYELSKLEGRVGGPERPLSDLGILSYRSYWSWVLLEILKNTQGLLKIKDISAMTSITQTDIISTLKYMKMVYIWRGEHVISASSKNIKKLLQSEKYKRPNFIFDKNSIMWAPKKYPSQPETSGCPRP